MRFSLRKKKYKTELENKIQEAMNKQGISTYNELMEKCKFENINNSYKLSRIFTGECKIDEIDIFKLSKILEVPIDFFNRNMKKQTKYYIEKE